MTSQPASKQNNISSHYRGESFGNCLPLTSVATSSQKDSASNDAKEEVSPIKNAQNNWKATANDEVGMQIYELQTEEEDSKTMGSITQQ